MMNILSFLASTSVVLYSLIWEDEEREEDDALLEGIVKNPGFDRLRGVDQSGPVSYIGSNNFIDYGISGTMPPFNRYDHSLAVWWLVKEKVKSTTALEIAALLHDASHTAFSHLGDHVFAALGKNKDTNNCYQDDIHLLYIDRYKFQNLTEKYGVTLSQLDHTQYKVLKSPRGSVCADNLQYIIHTAIILELIDKSLARDIINDVLYDNDKEEWFFNNIKLAKLFGELSINFTQNIYTSPFNVVFYQYFTKAILKAINCKLFSLEDFQYGTDNLILEKLQQSSNLLIKHYLKRLENIKEIFEVVNYEEDSHLKINNFTIRAVDPQIKLESSIELMRLSTIDREFFQKFNDLKHHCEQGYGIKFHQYELNEIHAIETIILGLDDTQAE